MRIQKHLKPEAVCAKHSSRYTMANPWYDAKSKSVCATDGRVAVMLPVETDNGEPTGTLPGKALVAFRKQAGRGVHELDILGLETTVQYGGLTYARDDGDDAPPPDSFPPVAKVIPARQKALGGLKPGQGPVVIGLDVKLLAALGKALGTDTVRLQIDGPESPIRVDPIHLNGDDPAGYGLLAIFDGETPSNGPAGSGAIMPVTVKSD